MFAVEAALDVSIVLPVMFTLSVPFKRTANPPVVRMYRSSRLMYDAPSSTKAPKVSFAAFAPEKVIVLVALTPFTAPIVPPACEPPCSSKVTAPAIPHTFNVLMTLSIVAKSPVGPTE